MFSALRRGVSQSRDPAVAAAELADQLGAADATAAVFFASPSYDPETLGAELAKRFEGVNVIGCTTAGEIAPNGYTTDSLVGLAFSEADFEVVTSVIDDLEPHPVLALTVSTTVRSLLHRLRLSAPAATPGNTFAVMLIDGLSGVEESVLAAIESELGTIPLVGGSAGDAMRFGETVVFHGGAFSSRRLVIALVHTLVPFEVFRTQHVERSEGRMVVTEADPVRRLVMEINAEPATEEYARQLGITNRDLHPSVLATHPVVVRVGGGDYARSIREANRDGSLSFYCAIDKGIVLSAATAKDIVSDLDRMFVDIERKIGRPSAVLGFDCIFRRLELEDRNLQSTVSQMLASNNTIGFSTYGEQFNAMHLNQTFTGVAFGSSN